MLTFLTESTGSRAFVNVAVVLASPFLATWLLASIRSRWPRDGEPPMVPHWIPWFGHGIAYLFDINRFGENIKKRFPQAGAVTSLVAGRHFYTILDPKLAGQIFRQPRAFGMEAFIVSVHPAFGMPSNDLKIMKMGIPGLEHEEGYEDDGRRVWKVTAKMVTKYMGVEGSIQMATTFLARLSRNLENVFPKGGSGWETVDLNAFVLKHFLEASVASLFGTHLLELWPTIYEDFWAYDEYTKIHIAQIPEIFARKAYDCRRKLLNILVRWEREARQHKDLDELIAEDSDWNEYWGAPLLRHKIKYCTENGLSPEARASMALTFIWGQNANAIPIALWTVLQCLLNPTTKRRVASAIESCRDPEGGFDMHKAVTHNYLKSVFLESLRYGVAAPTVRVVLETTQIGEYTFHKGNVIHLPSRILQMDNDVWSPNPTTAKASEFWDQRFLDPEYPTEEELIEKKGADSKFSTTTADPTSLPAATRSKVIRDRMQSMRAFGGGNHLCPGRYFALYEIIAGMATLFTMLDMEVDQEALKVNGIPVVNKSGIGGLPPDRKFMVRMKRK